MASSFSEIIISIIPGDKGKPGSTSGPIDATASAGIRIVPIGREVIDLHRDK
jgi:hypothetical protein